MAKETKMGKFTSEERERRAKKEIRRLMCICDLFSGDRRSLAEMLVNDIAFMTVTMDEAKSIIALDGIIEEYQNGENQKGYKKSSAVETYDKFANSRLRCIKQLCDMLPDAAGESPAEQVMKFIGGG